MVLTKDQILQSLGDIEILALTIYGEARGEPVEGQIAVANVVRNRAITNGSTYRTECLKSHQFSCWNETDPNKVILYELTEKLMHGMDFPHELKQQVWIASGIVGSALSDNTGGAKNYLEKKLYESAKAPRWTTTMTGIRFIGNHVFGSAS